MEPCVACHRRNELARDDNVDKHGCKQKNIGPNICLQKINNDDATRFNWCEQPWNEQWLLLGSLWRGGLDFSSTYDTGAQMKISSLFTIKNESVARTCEMRVLATRSLFPLREAKAPLPGESCETASPFPLLHLTERRYESPISSRKIWTC